MRERGERGGKGWPDEGGGAAGEGGRWGGDVSCSQLSGDATTASPVVVVVIGRCLVSVAPAGLFVVLVRRMG